MKQSEEWKALLLGLEVSLFLAQKTRAKGLDIVMGDIQSVGIKDSSVDVITMWDVIEHLARPLDALRESNRVLSPRGILILSTPNAGSILHSISLWMYRSGIGLLQKPARRVFAGHPLYYTPSALSHLLTRSGFLIRAVLQISVSSEMSFRGEWIEKAAQIVDVSLGRALKRRYRMVVIAQKIGQ